MTTPEHLGGDRYRVRIYIGKDPLTGKGRQLSRTYRAKGTRDANRQAIRWAGELAQKATDIEAHRGTVAGLVDEWEHVKRGHADTTRYRERSILAAIRDGLGHIRVEELRPRHIDAWYADLLAADRSPSTVHHYHRVLHGILGMAERYDYIPVAPTRKVTPPARARPNPRPPDDDVLVRLLEEASPGLRIAALLAARLGLRRGEIIGLKWSDIHGGKVHIQRSATEVKAGTVTLKATKTQESNRVVTLDDATARVLATWRRHDRDDDFVIADPEDGSKPYSPGKLSQAWKRLCRRVGVNVRFHDLRHWSATNMIGAGVPVTTVAARLGHSRTSTTVDVYAKALRGSDERAAAVLGALLPDNSVGDETQVGV